jgi:hypothetical protein
LRRLNKISFKQNKKKNRISDLAGTWDVTDEEIKDIKKSLEKGWTQ